MFFGQDNEEGGKTVSGFLALPIPIFWLVYFVVIESIYGATLGHQGLDLKVVTINRSTADWTQTFKRRLLDPIDIFAWGIPAIITVSNTDKHQRLGDLWAGTIVIDTKDPEQYSGSK